MIEYQNILQWKLFKLEKTYWKQKIYNYWFFVIVFM